MLSNYRSEDDHGRPYVASDDITDPEDIDV